MPPQRLDERHGLERALQQPEFVGGGDPPGQPLLDHRDPFCALHETRQRGEALDGDDHVQVDAEQLQLSHCRNVGTLAVERRRPFEPRQLVERDRVTDPRVVAIDEEDPAVVVGRQMRKALDETEGQNEAVDVAQCVVGPGDHFVGQRTESQAGTRCLFEELGGNRPAEHLLAVIRGVEDELARRTIGVEPGPRGEQPLDISHQQPEARLELRREGRQLVVVPDPNEQLVAELAAQPLERRGQRRLAPLQDLGSAGDALLGEQCVEGDEQVEVEIEEVDVDTRQMRADGRAGDSPFEVPVAIPLGTVPSSPRRTVKAFLGQAGRGDGVSRAPADLDETHRCGEWTVSPDSSVLMTGPSVPSIRSRLAT